MITVIVNQKGGVGKTTTAVHYASWLQRKKYKVLLVDSDAQNLSFLWAKSLPFLAISEVNPDELAEQIPLWSQDYEAIVIDGAGGLAATTKVILYYANVALIPCQPAALDLVSSGSVIKLVKQAQQIRPELRSAAFINRAIPRTRLAQETKEALTHMEAINFLPTMIHQRQCIADAFGQHSTVFDMGKAGIKSAQEYNALFQEVNALWVSPANL